MDGGKKKNRPKQSEATQSYLRVLGRREKEGRKEGERMCVCVCERRSTPPRLPLFFSVRYSCAFVGFVFGL